MNFILFPIKPFKAPLGPPQSRCCGKFPGASRTSLGPAQAQLCAQRWRATT